MRAERFPEPARMSRRLALTRRVYQQGVTDREATKRDGRTCSRRRPSSTLSGLPDALELVLLLVDDPKKSAGALAELVHRRGLERSEALMRWAD